MSGVSSVRPGDRRPQDWTRPFGESCTAGSLLARISGFTLVELLVSVAFIALLIGILLPSLKSARNNARRVACTANLKGIAAASLVYSGSDPHEQMIPVHGLYGSVGHDFGAYDYGGKSGIGEPQSGNDPASSWWGTQNGRGPATRPLNSILFRDGFTDYQNSPGPNGVNWLKDTRLDLDIFHCPSDRGYVGLHFPAWEASGLTSYDHYGNSYTAGILWDGTLFAETGDCVLYSVSVYLRSPTRVSNPANTVYYLENGVRFGWLYNLVTESAPSTGSFSECGRNIPFPLAGRALIRGWHEHQFEGTVSFADGHAGAANLEGHQRPATRLPYYPNLWDVEAPGYYEGVRCVIIRGPGWQLDTLPAPVVQSEVLCNEANTVFITAQ